MIDGIFASFTPVSDAIQGRIACPAEISCGLLRALFREVSAGGGSEGDEGDKVERLERVVLGPFERHLPEARP